MSTVRIPSITTGSGSQAAAAGVVTGAGAATVIVDDLAKKQQPVLPDHVEGPAKMAYRSGGLGIYAVVVRYCTMPLEKVAMIMNSSQVSGSGQMSQAWKIVFADGMTTPFRTVGRASIVAWFFQYSVMGFVFQICDRALSSALNAPQVPYGAALMEKPPAARTTTDPVVAAKVMSKAVLAPALAGTIESAVANRAEAQRFHGPVRFAAIERKLCWNPIARQCGPAYLANASRNFIMSATSFVITPTLYRNYFPQEQKSQSSLFWFGLGVNIFFGNVVAITQQSLWGRALDYGAEGGGRAVCYRSVISESLKREGVSAFFTPPKWFARVLMNAPIQGTVPWFYNEVLPLGEDATMGAVASVYSALSGPH